MMAGFPHCGGAAPEGGGGELRPMKNADKKRKSLLSALISGGQTCCAVFSIAC
jgi:hypothetical protein